MSRANVLVGADWAEQNLDAPNTVFVEVDEDTTAYDGGHIPGAVGSTGRPSCRTRSAATSSTRPAREAAVRPGIGNDDTVVLYGGNNNWFAAYAYWCSSSTATTTSS